MKKTADLVIYGDDRFYASFPSLVRLDGGELLCAFRRAPERRWYGGRCTHADPNSQLVLVRSGDGGATWSREPELIHAHALGGSQDPCLSLLPGGELICASYLWILKQPQGDNDPARDHFGWAWAFAGGYLVRSRDAGRHWTGPLYPPPVPGNAADELGRPLPAYNRGNILAGSDGLLYWAVTRRDTEPGGGRRTSVHLMVSSDRGATWAYRCPVAADPRVTFNETWLYETPAGDLVAFLRTVDPAGEVTAATARSRDRGRTFEPWRNAGFVGHPHCAVRLADGHALLAYGYRRPPFGIRARVLDPECREIAAAPEIVLREDGATADVGYPWAVAFPDGRVLVVYYFNGQGGVPESWTAQRPGENTLLTGGLAGGIRVIAGTWLVP